MTKDVAQDYLLLYAENNTSLFDFLTVYCRANSLEPCRDRCIVFLITSGLVIVEEKIAKHILSINSDTENVLNSVVTYAFVNSDKKAVLSQR